LSREITMTALSDEIRQKIEAEFGKYPNKRAVTLPALHIVQEAEHAVSPEAMVEIAELLELHPAEVADTMSFYGFFRDPENPLGANRVWVCRSISCMLRGGEDLLARLCRKFGVKPGQTTLDGKVTLEFAECLGMCEGAPCMLVNEDCHANLTEEAATELIEKL
jgi:NADH-quinone oxidoreductase subunit E